MGFTENASFKSYGVICWSLPLSHSLHMFPSIKGTTMASFQFEVYSDRSNNTIGSSLILAHRADTC